MLKQPWDGSRHSPPAQVACYGGMSAQEVKPDAEAVLLDAKAHVGKGKALRPGALVTARHIEEMVKAHALGSRGILTGDVVYVHTGVAPSLVYDPARYLADKRVVAVGFDTPVIDPVPDGMLQGKGGPAEGTRDKVGFRAP